MCLAKKDKAAPKIMRQIKIRLMSFMIHLMVHCLPIDPYIVVPVDDGEPQSTTKDEIDDCAMNCLAETDCIGFNISTGPICTPITTRANGLMNFYIYDRNSNSTIACPSTDDYVNLAENDGTWSDWVPLKACNDTCGLCGIQVDTRTCPSEGRGYPCEGDSTNEIRCADTICGFPRATCCPGTNIAFNATQKVQTCQLA